MPGTTAALEPVHPASFSASDDSLLEVLADAVARGSAILAPSERAARDLRSRFHQLQAASGRTTWTPARILTWSSWTSSLWSTLTTTGVESRLLLNAAQEHALWREVIQSGPALESLGSIDSMADLAAGAWSLAAGYEILHRIRPAATTQDARIFADWAAVFATHCASRQYLSAAEITTGLRLHVERTSLEPPEHLLLIGFGSNVPPARQGLLASLAFAGCNIQNHTPSASPSTQLVVRCDTPQHEAQTAARWIRTFVETRAIAGESARVALIVPQLDDERPTLEATLREVLAPELQHIDADLSAGPIAFSSGPPLGEYLLIAVALDLVRWLVEPLDQQRITALLLSPYIGHIADLPIRAEFDAFHLRKTQRLRPELTIAQFVRVAVQKASTSSSRGPIASGWAAQFQSLAQLSSQLTSTAQRSYADWMESIRSALRDANWPGDRPLTAQEFNAARAWEHVLDSVATLDFAGTRVPFANALQALDRQARQATTAPTQINAAVQVMRSAEAAGTTFDAILLLHATDALWPAPTRPNPLLSWPLQREFNMPGANPALTTAHAAETTGSLIASSPHILFFYPAEDETGPQRLSPVIRTLAFQEVSAEGLLPFALQHSPLATEVSEDTAPLPALVSGEVLGGARLLKAQAACAFMAFAEMRLGSTPVDTDAIGFDALENGNFLHDAMAIFWKETLSQANLQAMSYDERQARVRAAVDAATPRVTVEDLWDAAYIDLQKERATRLLLLWLDRELERTPFQVLEREVKKQVSVGPLTFTLRLDRIDAVELEDGATGTVLIDYKTGTSAKPKQWEGDRPEEPQLPLYAMLPEAEHLQAIAFAKLRAGKDMKWLGHSATPGIIPKPTSFPEGIASLPEQVAAWRVVLEDLANDYFNGIATVSPKDFPGTCKHCAQRLLCRLDPTALLASSDETEESDAST